MGTHGRWDIPSTDSYRIPVAAEADRDTYHVLRGHESIIVRATTHNIRLAVIETGLSLGTLRALDRPLRPLLGGYQIGSGTEGRYDVGASHEVIVTGDEDVSVDKDEVSVVRLEGAPEMVHLHRDGDDIIIENKSPEDICFSAIRSGTGKWFKKTDGPIEVSSDQQMFPRRTILAHKDHKSRFAIYDAFGRPVLFSLNAATDSYAPTFELEAISGSDLKQRFSVKEFAGTTHVIVSPVSVMDGGLIIKKLGEVDAEKEIVCAHIHAKDGMVVISQSEGSKLYGMVCGPDDDFPVFAEIGSKRDRIGGVIC